MAPSGPAAAHRVGARRRAGPAVRPGRTRTPAAWRRVGAVAGWVGAAALGFVCLLRGFQVLDTSWEVAVVGISPWVLAAAAPLLVAALAGRRWVLAAVAAVVTLCWCVWAGPDFWPFPRSPAAGPTLVRLFDANVSQSNRNLTEIAGEITRDHATLVTLEELTPTALDSLEATGAMAPYRWHSIWAEPGAAGTGIWSTVPLSHLSTWTPGGGQIEITGVVDLPGSAPVTVDVVHVFAPVFGPGQPATWHHQLADVAAHLADQPRPLLVAGDFNATWDMAPFRRILGEGLTDAAPEQGDGWIMTWPRDQSWVIPYLRVDHVLVSAGLVVTSYRVGDGRGSDHHPLLVGIGLPRHR